MTIEQAIRDAIEGGWNDNGFITAQFFPNGWSDVRITCGGYVAIQRAKINGDGGRWCEIGKYHKIFLDLLFWQALGKTRGFGPKQGKRTGNISLKSPYGYALSSKPIQWWEYTWHRFIDHLAENKSIESFFENLQ